MKKKSFIVMWLGAMLLPLYGQSDESIQRLIIKSPEVAAFERMGEIPVDLYTGTPKISIPLFEARSGDISLPITLDYHATAITVDQEASWVGLNWLLNAGGVVSTQIAPSGVSAPLADWRHLFEKLSFANYSMGDATLGYSYRLSGSHEMNWRGGLGFNLFPCVNPSPDDLSRALYSSILNYKDGEAQLYSANFMGHSFKFIYHKLEGRFIVVGKDQKYKIDGSPGSITKIVDPNGVEYYFGEVESIQPDTGGTMNFQTRSVSFYLTRIVSPSGREIRLKYTRYGSIKALNKASDYHYFNHPSKSNTQVDRVLSDYLSIRNSYLSEITSDDVIIRFSVGSRVDIRGDAKKLETITVLDRHTEKVIKRFRLSYDYFEGNKIGGDAIYDHYKKRNQLTTYHSRYGENEIYKRLKLLSLQEESINEKNVTQKMPAYAFSYDNTRLPAKTSAARDYWGFYNGRENTANSSLQCDHTLLVAKSRTRETAYNDFPYSASIIYADNRFNPNTAGGWMLTAIRYPTGGYTRFEYEPHKFTNFNYQDITYVTEPAFESLITFSTSVNATVPAQYTEIKYFTLKNETQLQFDVSYRKPDEHKWSDFRSPPCMLYHYITESTPNGPRERVYKVTSFNLNRADTVHAVSVGGGSVVKYQERVVLEPGKYHIQASSLPQIKPYNNFPNWRTEIKVSKPNGTSPITRGAGMRIKTIRQTDNDTELVTSYKYTNSVGLPTGILMAPIKFARKKMMVYQNSPSINGGMPTTAKLQEYWIQGSDNMVPAHAHKVGYSQVEVTKTNSSGNAINGKTVYEFWNRRNSSGISFDYNRPLEDPRNGLLVKETQYKGSNTLLKETEYTYTVPDKKLYYINAVVEDIYTGYDNACSTIMGNLHQQACGGGRVNMYIYPSATFRIDLAQKTEREYTENRTLQINETYTYNPNNLSIATLRRTANNGEEETRYFIYPQDYTQSGQTYPANLVSKHIIAKPLESVTTLRKTDGEYVTAGYLNRYGDIGKPTAAHTLDITAPLALKNFKFSNKSSNGVAGTATGSNTAYSPFSAYREKETCLYSSAGNPIQFTENGTDPVTYLWSYSKQYPIAEIRNATYTQVRTALGYTEAQMNALESHTNPDIPAIGNKLRDYFRNSPVQVTTYAYKPLTGIISLTDPTGTIIHYDYDSFGRLLRISDYNNKSLQEFKYNYKP